MQAATDTAPATARAGQPAVPGFARMPVLLVACAAGALLMALAARFGYFGDELYFLAAGRYHLAWGYADNPWLLPVLALAADAVTPGSPVGMHVLAGLLHVGGIVVTALIARELGGARRAQVLAAGAYAISFQLLASAHILASSTVDPFLWTLVGWLLVRWTRTRADRCLLAAGLVTAVAVQGKFLIVLLWLALVVAVLVLGPRAMLRRPALWVGGAVTVLVTVPTLVWQADHGWPYLQMQQVVAEGTRRIFGGPLSLLPLGVLFAGVLVGAFLLCHGLWVLLTDAHLRPYRFLGLATLLLVVIFLVTASRYYYVAGLYGPLFAASAARIERRRPAAWWRWVPTLPTYLVSAALAVVVALPVLPRSAVTNLQFTSSGSIGWPRVAGTAAAAYRRLPTAQRARAAVVAETYWQAAALDVYGPARGLPRGASYGAERGYWYYGGPPDRTRTVLYVGKDATRDYLRRFFADVRQVGVTRLDAKQANVNQHVRVWRCTGARASWPRLWNQLHRL